MSYWVFRSKFMDDGVTLSAVPSQGPKAYLYHRGVSLLEEYPARDNAIMCFDPNNTDKVKLYDIVLSIDNIFVVNEKVKAVFSDAGLDNVEYLPITIWGYDRQVVSQDYYIVNVLGDIDVIDMASSDVVMNRLVKGQVKRLKKLVLDESKISAEAKIFRASTKLNQIFINDELKNALDAAGVAGWLALPAQGWDGMDF